MTEDRIKDKHKLLFYDAYEEFYSMAKESVAFKSFCRDAFGEDFSQDGFSDTGQIIIPPCTESNIIWYSAQGG